MFVTEIKKNAFVFRKGDLALNVLNRSTIRLFDKSNYYLSLTWYSQKVKKEIFPIPEVIFSHKINESVFLKFMEIELGNRTFFDINEKQIVKIIEFMYKLGYTNKKYILDKIPCEKYSEDLALMIKNYDAKKAAEIANIIDWGEQVKKDFWKKLDKDVLVEIVHKNSQEKKRRRLNESSTC